MIPQVGRLLAVRLGHGLLENLPRLGKFAFAKQHPAEAVEKGSVVVVERIGLILAAIAVLAGAAIEIEGAADQPFGLVEVLAAIGQLITEKIAGFGVVG